MVLFKYFHTLRYLKLSQLVGRLWYLLYRPMIKLNSFPTAAPICVDWVASPECQQSMLSETDFQFLNAVGRVVDAVDWNSSKQEKLWLYNLHYFNDLNGLGWQQRSSGHEYLVAKWIADNPVGFGNGWEPYPLSIRIVNWIKWSVKRGGISDDADRSLVLQTRFLRKKLEFHILGNHLFENAKALVFSGLYFSGREASGWLAKGLSILESQLPEQVLNDGGHFERSAMYQSIVLEGLLDIINLILVFKKTVPDSVYSAANKMLRWAKVMSHPDGEIVLFNDAAFGVAAPLFQLQGYAKKLGCVDVMAEKLAQVVYLNATGYLRAAYGRAVLFVDIGPLGPDYLPGHGHADTFTYELSIDSDRLIVDTGTSEYRLGDERKRQRGTSAHNTLKLDGIDSSQVWSSFRVARRAKVFGIEEFHNDRCMSVVAHHDGYKHCRGSIIHKRSWRMSTGTLEIEDTLIGSGWHDLEIPTHFGPGLILNKVADNEFEIVNEATQIVKAKVIFDERLTAVVIDTTYHPEFGASIGIKKVVCRSTIEVPINYVTKISWV